MTQLYTRSGTEYTGKVQLNAKGKPTYTYDVACTRCHVINGQRLYVMGMMNGKPYSLTGFDCWKCGNTGVTSTKTAPLYTAEQVAKLNAAADKRKAAHQAIYQAEARKYAAERAEKEAAYRAQHADFLAKIATLCTGNGSDFWDRMAADLLMAFRSPSERQIALVDAEIAKRQQNATSAYIGALSDRIEIVGKIERVITTESFYGIKHINIIRCNDGNVVLYRGNYLGGKDDSVHIMATVAEHTEYNGVKQTIVQRPKNI
jgi:hypothetical protein